MRIVGVMVTVKISPGVGVMVAMGMITGLGIGFSSGMSLGMMNGLGVHIGAKKVGVSAVGSAEVLLNAREQLTPQNASTQQIPITLTIVDRFDILF